jgi:hypothetical protein
LVLRIDDAPDDKRGDVGNNLVLVVCAISLRIFLLSFIGFILALQKITDR